MTSSPPEAAAAPRRSGILGPLGRRAQRQARRHRPAGRAQRRAAVDWATAAAAALPDHTHAARLVGLVPPPPPGLPAFAGQDVHEALARSSATCLQRCLVLQSWLTAHGQPCEVAVGVRTTGGFEAHAWIPGHHGPAESRGYAEIARVPAPDAGRPQIRAARP